MLSPPPGAMHEEPYGVPDAVLHDLDDGAWRTHTSFSCSPRDFRLPAAMAVEEGMHHRRNSSRRAVLPRDKHKMRVSEMLHGEKNPSEFEVASEARLQRHLLGTTDRRRREWAHDGTSRVPWRRPAHEARIASLFGTARGATHEVPTAPRDPGALLDEELDDWMPSTPLALEAPYSSEDDEPIDDDPRSSPMDATEELLFGAASLSMHAAAPVPVPGAEAQAAHLGTKRKHESSTNDDSPGWARRRRPMLLATRKASARTSGIHSTSPRSTSPRRVSLLHGQGALVSPSSSPLALGEPRRRASTPIAQGSVLAPFESASGTRTSRPSSPSTAWRTHTGSGPGYGSGAIGLRLGVHAPWEGVSLSSWLGGQAEGREVDEGVRCMGLG